MSYWQNSLSNNTDGCCKISVESIVEEQYTLVHLLVDISAVGLGDATDGESMD